MGDNFGGRDVKSLMEIVLPSRAAVHEREGSTGGGIEGADFETFVGGQRRSTTFCTL